MIQQFSWLNWIRSKFTSRRTAKKHRQAGRPSHQPALVETLENRVLLSVTPLGVSASQNANSSTLTNYTVNAGTDRLLVVAVGDPGSPTNPTGVTFNGQAMTQGNATSDGQYSNDAIWYLKLGTGAAVTGNIVVSFAGTEERFIGASAYSGVDQSTPIDANGPKISGNNNGTALAGSLDVPSQTGDLVFDIVDTYENTASPTVTTGPGQTVVNNGGGAITVTGGFDHYVTSTEKGAPNVTMSWASNSTAILHVAMNINAAAATQNLSFGAATNTAVGSNPGFVVVSDFNGDGNSDVVVPLNGAGTSNNVKVLLGNGSGGFSSTVTLTAGNAPIAAAVGDFNRDGKQDLAITNNSSNNVSIFLGNGSGAFGAATNFTVGASPNFLKVADVNNDRIADLVVANTGTTTVSVLLGNGSGGFGAKTDFSIGTSPNAVVLADFNGDGKLDLATANSGPSTVSILIGNGSGSFGAPTSFSTGAATGPSEIVARDFNNDGKMDIATANNGTNTVSVLLGNGAGSLGSATNIATGVVGAGPYILVADDFNGDGKDDLAAANFGSANNLAVLLGNGTGGFASLSGYTASNGPVAVASGDFNNDGKADLVAANYNSGDVSVLLNTSSPAGNQAPALAVSGNITYTENNAATAIDTGITVSDADNATLASGTVTITNFVAGQDVLSFTNDGLTMGNIGVSTNVGGVLTLTSSGATATTAQWQAALRAVKYSNTSDAPNTTTRSVDFVVNDGTANSNTQTSTINISATNDAPALSVSGNITYTENDPATAIATGLTVSDVDNATLASATVTITNFVAGQDVLAFTNDGLTMGNIAINTNVGGVLSLTSSGATATKAQWQAALRAVKYSNSSDAPNTTTRSVDFVVNDGTANSNTQTSTINISATNDVPVLAVSGNITYTENDPATAIDTGLTVSDVDNATLASATVTITNFVAGQDVLAFTNDGLTMGNIAVSTNVAGVLTLTSSGATATKAQWQAALRAVTYFNSSDTPNTTARSVDFVVNDGTANSNTQTSTINISATNDAPVLAVSGNITYTENDPATAIDTGLTVSDVDNATLASATVTITNFVAGQDVLAFTNDGLTMGNIAVSTNVAGVLTLTSSGATATKAQWQAALRAVTYFNSSDTPNTTARSVDFVVNDGTANSNPQTSTINISASNDAPVLAVSGNITYTENDTATAIDTGLTVSDADNATLASATVTITNFVVGQDVLAFTNDGLTMGNITINTNAAGVLTLTSAGATATTAQWQAALRAVTYFNSSDTPSTTSRSVDFVVNDGSANSNIQTSTINITAANDAPSLSVSGNITYTENDPATAIDTGLTVSDVDNATLASATVTITNVFPLEDVLLFTNDGLTMGNIAVSGNALGILTLTSAGATATKAEWQAALRAVTYANTSDAPTTITRSVSFVVNDGTTDSNAVTSTISVTAANDAPVLANIEANPLPYAPGAPATAITSSLTLTDADSANLTGATIQISAGYQSGDLLAFTNAGNITGGVFNTATRTLTLTGSDTVANYQAALQSVTYVSSSTSPAARTISFQVTDGTAFSNVATRVVGGVTQLSGTTLNVYGTGITNNISITEAASLDVVVDGVLKQYTPAAVTAINIYGLDGNDSIIVNSLLSGTALTAFGGNGNDTLRVDASVTSSVTLDGGDGNDLLVGGSGDDTLLGGIGNDYLTGGEGSDTLTGGAGNDVYTFNDASVNQFDTVTELLNDGTDKLNFSGMTNAVVANLTSDTLLATMAHRIVRTGAAGQAANLENVSGGAGNDTITGNAVNNDLYGNGGNDTINGGDGNDYLDGGDGADLLNGGNNDDILLGGIGDDYLRGNAGTDLLVGGDGYDVMLGGTGDDTYRFTDTATNDLDVVTELVGEGTDTLDFSTMTVSITADLTNDTVMASTDHRLIKTGGAGQAANFENFSGGSANDQVIGNAANNLLRGNGGNDHLTAGAGNDILLGGDGNDVLKGISGANILIGGTGADILQGGADDDLLLTGSLSYETNQDILESLRGEWSSINPYQTRVNHLLGAPGGINTGFVLSSSTVTTDAVVDYVTGNAGRDWFLANSAQDVISDKAVDEVFTHIDSWV